MVTGQPGYYMPQQAPTIQPMLNPPCMVNGQTFYPQGGPPGAPGFQQGMPVPIGGGGFAMGAAPPFVAGNPSSFGSNPPSHPMPPDISGVGRTPQEEQLRQVQFAYSNQLFEPQEFKPADDDPSRFYYVRELDGNWTQRNRFSIDHMGNCRWFITDEGWFYAVRLPD